MYEQDYLQSLALLYLGYVMHKKTQHRAALLSEEVTFSKLAVTQEFIKSKQISKGQLSNFSSYSINEENKESLDFYATQHLTKTSVGGGGHKSKASSSGSGSYKGGSLYSRLRSFGRE